MISLSKRVEDPLLVFVCVSELMTAKVYLYIDGRCKTWNLIYWPQNKESSSQKHFSTKIKMGKSFIFLSEFHMCQDTNKNNKLFNYEPDLSKRIRIIYQSKEEMKATLATYKREMHRIVKKVQSFSQHKPTLLYNEHWI